MTPRGWKLVVAPSAERSLHRLPEKVAAAIAGFITGALIENPRRLGHELTGDLHGLWAARRGAYRVVYEIRSDPKEVRVLRIDHRADVYQPR